ncbi:MAG: 30S ribosomal protein S7 [archaeon]
MAEQPGTGRREMQENPGRPAMQGQFGQSAPQTPARPHAHKPAEEKKFQMPKTLVFGKWSTDGIRIADLGLAKYINLETKMIPHSFGKMSRGRFKKAEMSIVERLANKVMRSGQGKRKLSGKYIRGRNCTGKKLQTLRIIEKAFEITERQAKENPLQVLIKAIENSAPREDTTRIKRGGVMYTVAVDLAPLKRIDEALKNIALAAFQASFKSKTSAEEGLARELTLAAKGDSSSFAVKRRDEVERIAKASR